MRKEDFYTLPKATEGVEFPLEMDGKPTGHFLRIRGTDCEQFRKARFDGARRLRDIPEGTDEWQRGKIMDEIVLDTLTSLVAGWSFEDECTPEAVRELLHNAPHLADAVDKAAGERARFFGIDSQDSKPTQKPS